MRRCAPAARPDLLAGTGFRDAAASASMPLAAATILLSAFLLFLVQPIVGRQILPWFGGTPGVWTTCLVFFQTALLGGYAYAHAVTRALDARRQAYVHIALLAASLALLPIVPSAALKPTGDEDAALRILVLLGLTIGLPYFLLSATGPLLQSWVAHRFERRTVYRLFALSNFGSLLGLLAFPFVIEPFASSRAQAWGWSAAYALFAIACAATAWAARTRPTPPHVLDAPTSGDASFAPAASARPAAFDRLLWLVLAALGSVLLLSATSHITQNIASVPFLWVLPLALYLLTFVLAFEGRGGRGLYDTRWGTVAMLATAVPMAAGLTASNAVLDVTLAVPLYVVGMFFGCLFCHGELAARKPSPVYLTQFYLTLALGGALGGLGVGLVAPRVFPAYYELPLALFALAALALLLVWTNRRLASGWVIPLSLAALAATVATAYLGLHYASFLSNDTVVMQRNFFGTLRVRETGSDASRVRRLLHGVILHGEQPAQPAALLAPGTYYAPTSGIGLAIAAKQRNGPLRLGVVGLGVGTLSVYGRAGDTIRFYELDPDVLHLARTHFDYLSSAAAAVEVELGDARLSLERELARGELQRFDVLAIDAFSSDAIPVHLITREAIELYVQHLAADGILAVHISNRFLDLAPVLANIAPATGLTARLVSDTPAANGGASKTDWVLLARAPEALAQRELALRSQPLPPQPALRLWTDQFNNLFDVLKTRPRDAWRRLLEREPD